jgi:hypothetical protein
MQARVLCLMWLSLSTVGLCQQVNPPIDPRTNMNGYPTSSLAYRQPSLKDLETKQEALWRARETGNAKAAKKLLGPKASVTSYSGAKDVQELIAQVGSGVCKVKSFELTDFTLKYDSPTTGVLSYKAAQDAVCEGRPLPPNVNVKVAYWNIDGKWAVSFYVEEIPK